MDHRHYFYKPYDGFFVLMQRSVKMVVWSFCSINWLEGLYWKGLILTKLYNWSACSCFAETHNVAGLGGDMLNPTSSDLRKIYKWKKFESWTSDEHCKLLIWVLVKGKGSSWFIQPVSQEKGLNWQKFLTFWETVLKCIIQLPIPD